MQDLGPCESCCGTGRILLSDPPPNTKEQNIEFRKAWDMRVKASDGED